LQDNRTGIAAFAKERASEEVEDSPALPTAIIDHDAMAVVGGLACRERMPVGTLQAMRLEQVQ
jgi:hypothetical protein